MGDIPARARLNATVVSQTELLTENWTNGTAEQIVFDEAALKTAVGVAFEESTRSGPDSGREFTIQLAAWTAWSVVKNAGAIFNVPADTRDSTTSVDFVVTTATRLAVGVVEEFEGDLSGIDHLHAEGQLRSALQTFHQRYTSGSGGSDDATAISRIAFHVRSVCTGDSKTQTTLSPPSPPPAGEPPSPPGPDFSLLRPKPGRRRRLLLAAAMVGAAVLVIGGGVLAISGAVNQGSVPTSASVDERPSSTVFSGTKFLPNTRAELTLETGSGNDVQPGDLPTFAPLIVHMRSTATFHLKLSRLHPDQPADNLSFFVQVIDPVTIQGGRLLADRHHSEQRNLDLGNSVVLTDLAEDKTVTTYEFNLAATPGKLNVGYWCGYSPKPMTVVISANDNAEQLSIPYPVFVTRSC